MHQKKKNFGMSPSRQIGASPERQFGTSPGWPNTIFKGRLMDVGGGRPWDQYLPARKGLLSSEYS